MALGPVESVQDQIKRLLEERLAELDLADLTPSPAAADLDAGSLGTYDVYLENISWAEPAVTVQPVGYGFAVTITYTDYFADLIYVRTCDWNLFYCNGPDSVPGTLSIGSMVFAVELVDTGSQLEVDPASVSTTLDNVEVDIEGPYAVLLELFMNAFIDGFEDDFETAMIAVVESVLEGLSPGVPGEPVLLAVTRSPSLPGSLEISYVPACDAMNHTIYYGPLGGVSLYDYAGAACGIGTTGSSTFDPGGLPSAFFIVVGEDGSEEGSYGKSSAGVERPEDVGTIDCDRIQNVAGVTCE
jgi:hypothetical protein